MDRNQNRLFRWFWLLNGDDTGATLVLFPILLTIILGLLALGINVGLTYIIDAKLATAVDAAAFAGVQALPVSPSDAEAYAYEYAAKNGIPAENVEVEISDDNSEIKVIATKDVDYFLAGLFGISPGLVRKEARASVKITTTNDAAPWGVLPEDFDKGEEYVLKEGGEPLYDGDGDPIKDSDNNPVLDETPLAEDWFGALLFPGNEEHCMYRGAIRFGYQGQLIKVSRYSESGPYTGILSVGDVVKIRPGLMARTEQGVKDPWDTDWSHTGVNLAIGACNHTPPCTADNYVEDCLRVIIVPIVEMISDDEVRIVGFGRFFLEEFDELHHRAWGTYLGGY